MARSPSSPIPSDTPRSCSIPGARPSGVIVRCLILGATDCEILWSRAEHWSGAGCVVLAQDTLTTSQCAQGYHTDMWYWLGLQEAPDEFTSRYWLRFEPPTFQPQRASPLTAPRRATRRSTSKGRAAFL